ncbi:hypothetical protein [Sulfitobacter dubius]|uniref:hypothetical protein n=1 Tax=Sulfitobacter dubius TaxID=218673 RepID=UPI0022AEAC9C|nr:hypothetical protein [Sulfitobacter dubius]MCZ4367540.1 hypothetical protein [Sulfitobacter dubius]
MLQDIKLHAFMKSFLGYGDFDAETWFVGMEEGGGNNLEDIQTRINTWAERGERILEDCAEYHHAIGARQLFTPPVRKAQSTWDWLMRAQLKSEGEADDCRASKKMQGERWLRSGSRTCGIELLPLPSPSTGVWLYSQFSDDPVLGSRARYRAAMLPSRIAAIQGAIEEHKPRNVVFYGTTYEDYWRQLAGADFLDVDGLRVAQSSETCFLSTPHPTRPVKVSKISYWKKVGERLAAQHRPNENVCLRQSDT